MNFRIKNPGDLPLIDYRTVNPLQGNLKDLSEENYGKIKASIKRFGFVYPLFVWFNEDGAPYTIDGHGRLRVLNKETAKPFKVPYVRIDAADEQEAKELILVATSQYQRITERGLKEFTKDMSEGFLYTYTSFDAIKPWTHDQETDQEHQETPGKEDREQDANLLEENKRKYDEASTKQIVLYFVGQEYEEFTEIFEKVKTENNCKTNGETFMRIIHDHQETTKQKK